MNLFFVFFKGMAMGAANVIPGVSGGTIAFITGIYERLINAIKSFDLEAAKLLLAGKFKAFVIHVDLYFLIALFAGIGLSIVSLAKLLEFLLLNFEVLTMAFFFGLIISSVLLVGKQVERWGVITVLMFIIGTAVAAGIAFLNPATADDSFFYLFLCGVVAICSMILPGLSGSFVLLIMGNYLLVLGAIGRFDMDILIPLGIGCVIGLVAFSYLLAFIFKHFKDATIAILTGFVFGSLVIIWPWKETEYMKDEGGTFVTKENGDLIEAGFLWHLPGMNMEFLLAVLLIAAGALAVYFIEKSGEKRVPEAK
ncbi:MAG: DUF368 domain-containing protein [Bacteroidia bacterium]